MDYARIPTPLALTWLLLAAGPLAAVTPETEPNDTKALANVIALPAVSTPAVIAGDSVSAAGTGLDYFRLTTAAQAIPGFYRHRLIIQSATPGHTATIRGLNQVAGVPGTTDSTVQTSSTSTNPPRFIQWYTSELSADIYVRISGVAATTLDYELDYEVSAVAEVLGPSVAFPGSITITSVGQTTGDTDLWVYSPARVAIPGFGNDDQFNTTSLQSELIRNYGVGTFYLAISNFNVANNLGSPPDDDFQTAVVLDFPGAIANSSTTVAVNCSVLIGGSPLALAKIEPFQVIFVRFTVGAMNGFVRGDSNMDGQYNIADPIFTLDVLFGGGGTVAPCNDACDANDDEAINIADPIYVLADQFSGGPSPPVPFPSCGTDPAGVALDCAGAAPCP